jgi:GTPase SAR1 family protein
VKPTGKQVLVLGLEGSGKTSLLHCFATGSLEQDVTPTQGFNAVSINREDLQIEFLESECNLHITMMRVQKVLIIWMTMIRRNGSH